MTPNEDRLAQTLIELVRVRSVNPFDGEADVGFREQEMAEDLLSRMQAMGLETGSREVAPGRPNIWGRLKGSGNGPTIMLAAHLDTVGVEGYEDAFEAQLKSGRINGRGSCDMKAAFACYLEVVHMLRARGISLPGDLIIAGVVDEEHLLRGSAEMGENGPDADFGIIGEPTNLAICPAHKGQMCAKIYTRGIATHSSRPENGVNAVEHMGAIIQHLSELNTELQSGDRSHPLCGTGRFSMNVIRGGTFASGIPDRCELEVDRRYLPGEEVGEILADYRARLDGLKARIPNLSVEVVGPTLHARALDVPLESPLVSAIVEAVQLTLGSKPVISAFPGGTDAPNLGFPCVICGPGDLAQAHSIDESVELEQMVQATEIYFQTIMSLNVP